MITLRHAEISDAPALITLTQKILADPTVFMLRTAAEFDRTIREQEALLRDFQDSPNSLFIVAESQGELIGYADLKGGRFLVEQHVAELSIAIVGEWRGKGVGQQLIDYLIAWAKANPMLKKIFLFVAAPNEGAIRLYERCGFVKEGCLLKDYYRNGIYYDSYIMGLWLGD